MDIREASATFGLIAKARSTRNNVAGVMSIGIDSTTITLPTENAVAYAVRFTMGSGGSATIDLTDGTTTGAVAGTAHVETATCVGTAGAAGNVTITLSGSQHPSANKSVVVAVANADTASAWATKVRAALTADTDISSVYTIGGTGADVVLTDKTKNDDNSFNIEIATAVSGLTPDATSTTTTAGVASVVIEDDGLTFEGKTPAAITVFQAVAFMGTGEGLIDLDSATAQEEFTATTTNPFYRIAVNAGGLDGGLYFGGVQLQASGPSTVITIIVHGTTA